METPEISKEKLQILLKRKEDLLKEIIDLNSFIHQKESLASYLNKIKKKINTISKEELEAFYKNMSFVIKTVTNKNFSYKNFSFNNVQYSKSQIPHLLVEMLKWWEINKEKLYVVAKGEEATQSDIDIDNINLVIEALHNYENIIQALTEHYKKNKRSIF